jgi:Flagellar GTP-binding protein
MEYITISADSYEDAVAKAKAQYGENIRIHSRRNYQLGGGLFAKKRNRTEIIFYTVKQSEKPEEKVTTNEEIKEFEKEAKTPDPETLSEEERRQTVLTKASAGWEKELDSLLDVNDIKGPLKDTILDNFVPNSADFRIEVSDRILSHVRIDYVNQAHPRKYLVLVGPTGSGKTTTIAKIASLYKAVGKKVGLVTLDYFRVGADAQIATYAKAFSVPISIVSEEDQVLIAMDVMKDRDLVIIDTMGISPSDSANMLRLKRMLSFFPRHETLIVMTCPATSKSSDLMKQYKNYESFEINSLITTKLDETESLGSILSFAFETELPLLFCTNGQKVPSDIQKASTSVILENLKRLGYDSQSFRGQL